MAMIIDGRAAARDLRDWVRGQVTELRHRTGVQPRLRVLVVGNHPGSRAYVHTKARMAHEVGIKGEIRSFPESLDTDGLLRELANAACDPTIHGILVQLPLPAHIDTARVLDAVPPEKDVDGFHPLNVGRMWSSRHPLESGLLLPCTPLGCMLLLEAVLGREGLRGRRAVVVGRSNIVGKPMAALLLSRDCTVTVAHSRTADLAERCREAEILIVAVGQPRMIRGDWVREGAIVIDVGINRIEDRDGTARIVGDVAFDEVLPRAGAITPVPGGVGPMTVASLLSNTLLAARRAAGLELISLPRPRLKLKAG